jgi:hypothetical protein
MSDTLTPPGGPQIERSIRTTIDTARLERTQVALAQAYYNVFVAAAIERMPHASITAMQKYFRNAADRSVKMRARQSWASPLINWSCGLGLAVAFGLALTGGLSERIQARACFRFIFPGRTGTEATLAPSECVATAAQVPGINNAAPDSQICCKAKSSADACAATQTCPLRRSIRFCGRYGNLHSYYAEWRHACMATALERLENIWRGIDPNPQRTDTGGCLSAHA